MKAKQLKSVARFLCLMNIKRGTLGLMTEAAGASAAAFPANRPAGAPAGRGAVNTFAVTGTCCLQLKIGKCRQKNLVFVPVVILAK